MLTKRDHDLIRSLSRARDRRATGLFVAEGIRLVQDMLGAFACEMLVADAEHHEALRSRLSALPVGFAPRRVEVVERGFDFGRISHQQTPQPVLALFALPEWGSADEYLPKLSGLTLLLDRVQDPGNVGTIIRTADWFGLRHILYTEGTADPFAPKVVQSTMGALARVALHPTTPEALACYRGKVLGTFLDGESIYHVRALRSEAEPSAMLVMGNEGVGISPEVAHLVTHRLTIPCLAQEGPGSESLNVAIATAICLSELTRPHL